VCFFFSKTTKIAYMLSNGVIIRIMAIGFLSDEAGTPTR
jgi:hypothetical protein